MNKRISALDITLGGMFVALMAVGANITAIAPFMEIGGVPITLQTFFAILAGLLLGSRLGAFTLTVYMALGLAGARIFAQFSGGPSQLISPTFGFILSFILVAYVVGKIVERKRTLPMYIVAALTGLVINYVFGTNWLYMAYIFWFEAPGNFSYSVAWAWMLVPLPKDIVLSIIAAVFGYRLEKSFVANSSFRKQSSSQKSA
ncbi:biotin transporter BioY [Pontibacillus litoralis]|uniref:Biotin transporter n=1 Tax=Pontibacillus litoralis JSM 072002 TaxID=1385512 RepID=A0A0A5G4W4_9BACI|nr:biotin transporter BioY [Pontibacillus litoralis]KGX87074.1 biotin biosynthesis protein BioC [Pontibacillus litoralis JSM 072002]